MTALDKSRNEYVEGSKERKKRLEYHQKYNTTHSDTLAARKKDRYKSDPAYRAAAIKRATASYERKKKLLDEVRRLTGRVDKRNNHPTNRYCPTCNQALPKPVKPVYKAAGGYAIAMYTISVLSHQLGRQVKTVQKWLHDGFIPDTTYKEQTAYQGRGKALCKAYMARLWTQDQVETLMKVFSKYDFRPPCNFKRSGLLDEIKTEWKKLQPLGIDPALYTSQTEHGYKVRPSPDLPRPYFLPPERKAG